jgi:hypothetical protein
MAKRHTYMTSILIMLFFLSSTSGQIAISQDSIDNEASAQKYSLILDLESLNTEASKIDAPLARASAKAEIAFAAWTIKQTWAQELLSDAYDLTLPEENERTRLREQPAGTAPAEPTETDLARNRVRQRILEIARQDKDFAERLSQKAGQKLGPTEEVRMYGALVANSIQADDTKAAASFAQRAIETDPTQIVAGLSILEIASRDRELADKLIVEYINSLRSVPLSQANAARIYLSLRFAVSPNPNLDPNRRQIAPAGPEATKAYVSYLIESLTALDAREPGSAVNLRSYLLSIWPLVNQHSPELIGQFLTVEKVSRGADKNASLPTAPEEERYRATYEERLKNAYKNRNQKEVTDTLSYALGRQDFSEARKLIELVSDEKIKTRYLEDLNTRESIALARDDELTEAESIARQLQTPKSILRAYPVIITKCVARKNASCVNGLSFEAVKRLKRADDHTSLPRTFGELAKAIAPADAALALEILDEMVKAANSNHANTDNGKVGFDVEIFATLAPKDENRTRQSACMLQDRLQRIVALAAIYKWKRSEITRTQR